MDRRGWFGVLAAMGASLLASKAVAESNCSKDDYWIPLDGFSGGRRVHYIKLPPGKAEDFMKKLKESFAKRNAKVV